ncbi:hypothetical protein RGU75_07675 [Glaciimonas sp. CA11.2]|uniref:hypothetical protein n=2 Tax=Glaciimonas sp. CA11.2 TaxID=3048601 RepID=UPI002AB5B785|nr:hypothetical protein [Glaciimonas sp. CA11.2]MDY7546107.1 hypothetical protein [Glaciimonas sp. CA11.2]
MNFPATTETIPMTTAQFLRRLVPALAATTLLAYGSVAIAQTTAAAAPVRVRATIQKVTPDTLEVSTKAGKKLTLKLASDLAVMSVSHAAITDIKSDSFIGSAAIPLPDGNLKALEVTVFPAGMKSGEGHYAWDLGKKSTMTNGTVGDVVVTSGRTITVKYPDGEKKIVVPADVPIVSLNKADRSLLVAGAHGVFVVTKAADGSEVVSRALVGINGVVPPM